MLEYVKRRKLIKHIQYWIYSKHHVYEISPYYSSLFGMYYLTNIKKFDQNCRISQNFISFALKYLFIVDIVHYNNLQFHMKYDAFFYRIKLFFFSVT